MGETASGVWLNPKTLGKKRERRLTNKITIYICIVLIASLGSYGYWIRTRSIFACKADGYNADRYIAYCNGKNFADYEHGAFAFDLEPRAESFARDADVLFLGNSRLQFAFSTSSTPNCFSAASARYYLLGYTYFENMVFAEQLLRKLRPRAKVYVINVDDFFDRTETAPVNTILHDPTARTRYEKKRLWQRVHAPVCKMLPFFCGHQYAYFRSRETGSYAREAGGYELNDARSPPFKPVSYDPALSENVVERNTSAAIDFLSDLPAQKKCVILTTIPTVGTKIANAKAIASALDEDLVMPEVTGLLTFDGSHLAKASAERWSEAFFQAAGPKIRSCLEGQGASPPLGHLP
jgi:hypothetical protein